MKLHTVHAQGRHLVTGYGPGYIAVNQVRYAESLLVTPEEGAMPWDAGSFETLTAMHFQSLMAKTPEIVIFGSGPKLHFPPPALVSPFAAAGVGFEAMDTRAACRTYNVLVSEGRRVIAALLAI